MRHAVMVALLLGCGGETEPANSDASLPDATLVPPDAVMDFFGEPCMPNSTPLVNVLCHRDETWPGGYSGMCIEGACRPQCGYWRNGYTYDHCAAIGGVRTWTGPNDSGSCYCLPLR